MTAEQGQQLVEAFRQGYNYVSETLQVSLNDFADEAKIDRDSFTRFVGGATPNFTPAECNRIETLLHELLDAGRQDTGLSPFDQIRLYAEARNKR